MIEVELADAIIRIGDLAAYLGLDLGGATVEKLAYNSVREDHKIENRRGKNGKKF
jgi:ribosome-associated protein YbcJ (S4-like RNA binding protein)